jgi:hypothetical protein
VTAALRGRALLAPGAPFLVSLALSLATVGRHVFWQDSGFFLCAAKELSVLYPPGFVLYVLLARAWASVFFFLDFTLAVHLFSSFCAALAAAFLGLTARDVLRSRGPWLGVGGEGEEKSADGIGAAVGSLAACGYTFWFSGIYAKVYALLFAATAFLLWRIVVADARRTPRDLTWVAAAIGLAWQAHPSITLAGPALAVFAALHAKALGWKGFLGRAALAAAVAVGPSLLLPVLARGSPRLMFGEPQDLGDVLSYLTGRRFTGKSDFLTFDPSRWVVLSQYFWEEFLGVPLALLAVGAARLARARGRVLAGLALWVVPFVGVTTLFVREGQQDFWYVAAWMPLWLTVAVGLREAAARLGPAVAAGAAAAGLAWAIAANFGDVRQRGYDLAEVFGRIHLEPLDPDAILILGSDDSSSTTHYLQVVRGLRPDVTLVRMAHLGNPGCTGPGWYDARLRGLDVRLREPDYAGLRRRFPRAPRNLVAAAAFAAAQAPSGRPVYFEVPPPEEMLQGAGRLVPAGPLYRLAPPDRVEIDPRAWELPLKPEEVRARYRRARGQQVLETPDGPRTRPEAYERRLFVLLLRARMHLAEWKFARGEYAPAASLYESILALDPETHDLPEVLYPLAVSYRALGRPERARPLLERLRALGVDPGDPRGPR